MEMLYNIEQGTPEWLELRKGRMTASHAQEIAANGKGLETLCRRLAAQIYTDSLAPTYKNDNMICGSEEEHFARSAYEFETGQKVEQVGFVIYSDFVGSSPDGLVGTDGGVEYKRKTFEKHNDLLLNADKFETKYVWQCHMNMLILNRQWWDLVSYNPLFRNKSIYKERIYRESECDAKLLAGFQRGEQLIKEYINQLLNG